MPGASSLAARPPWNWPLIYLGVALSALATTVFELALNRVLAVLFPPWSAFFAVSLALLGLAAGGLVSHLYPGSTGRLFRRLGLTAALNSFCVVCAVTFLLLGQDSGAGLPVVSALAGGAPFLCAGAVLATAVAETAERVNRVYLAAFSGAAAGCLLLVPLLASLGGPNTLLGAAVLWAASAAVWFTASGSLSGRVLAVATALGWATLIGANVKYGLIEIRWAKGAAQPEPLYVRWNNFSRVAVHERPGDALWLDVDAEGATPIAGGDPDRLTPEQRQALLSRGPGLAYLLRPNARTLVLNPGGGEELLRAVAGSSRSITAVETNPLIAETVRSRGLAPYTGTLYERPEVRLAAGDGRRFLWRTRERYEIVQVLPGPLRASLPAGGAALSDSRLFTVEAFEEYLDCLTDDGLLVLRAPASPSAPSSDHLAAAALTALRSLGEREPDRHLLLLREPSQGDGGEAMLETLIVARRPLTQADLEAWNRLAAEAGLGAPAAPPLTRGAAPPTDNRPYVDGAFAGLPAPGPGASRQTVRAAAAGAAAAALAIAFAPLMLRRRRVQRGSLIGFLPAFLFFGAGAMFVQAGLIQSLLPWLGSPAYTLTAAVCTLYLAAGLGSRLSPSWAGVSAQSLAGVLALAALVVAALAVIFGPLVSFGRGWPLTSRLVFALLLVAPAGFLMGAALAAGLSRIAGCGPPAVRLAWTLHAAAAVLGSVGAVLAAHGFGLRETMLLGGLMYLGAAPAVRFAFPAAGGRPAPACGADHAGVSEPPETGRPGPRSRLRTR